ncbi:MAG: hypothetical protein KDA41_05170, partial [Planctomycetales bacterium]|nr:hypothetical protein [Planctomycetales bacterium]
IALAVGSSWQRFVDWFSNPNVSVALKVVLLVVGSIVALANIEWLVPLGVAAGLLYGVYYAVRVILIAVQRDREAKRRTAVQMPLPFGGGGPRDWEIRARQSLSERPVAQRMTELLGSLIISGVVVSVLSVVTMILAGQPMGGALHEWGPQLAWVALSGIAGAWTVLVVAKVWEGDAGDQVLRRFWMLAIGLALGFFAFAIDATLMLDMNYGELLTARSIPASLHTAGDPSLAAYMAFFGGLFVILRWWVQAEALRGARVSVWTTALSALWGFILPFPQPWGVLLATTISLAVQLAAPWIGGAERADLKQRYRLFDAGY